MKKLMLLLGLFVCLVCFAREPTGIVAHWKMNDNAAGTAVFDSVGTANGIYTDLATGVNTSTGSATGKTNTALDLDTDEWINIGNQTDSILTISMWVNEDSIAGNDYPIDLNGTDYISIETATVTKNGFAGGTQVIYVDGVVAATVTAGNWHHIVLTTTTGKTASDLDIGRLEGTGYFDGLIDNVMLFNRALSEKEVKILYNGGHGTEIVADLDRIRRNPRRTRNKY